jgi:hypothetical protein
MKILITENKFKDAIKLSLKELGTASTINNIGGWENFCTVLNNQSPMEFLNLFNDLEQVQSVEKEHLTLFRYKKGYNYMIYNRQNEVVYINYREIWSFLKDKFGLNESDIQSLTQEWLDEVYNLRGITTVMLRR